MGEMICGTRDKGTFVVRSHPPATSAWGASPGLLYAPEGWAVGAINKRLPSAPKFSRTAHLNQRPGTLEAEITSRQESRPVKTQRS